MKKLKVYKFIVISNRAPRIRFRSANWVGSEKGRYLVTPSLDTGCRVGGVTVKWYQSLGLGDSGIKYMIEKHVFSNVLTDVDVLVFCIDGSSSKSS